MNDKAPIKKALVILSPDLIRPDSPEDSTLLRRAVALAKATGCELELFHVCYDDEVEDGMSLFDLDLAREKQRYTDKQAMRVAELATRLRRQSITVSHDTRWDYPRTDAILRKIVDAEPSLVMKQAREHRYILGIAANTDWELARRSPADVWLVNKDVADVDKIISAVGTRPWRSADDKLTTDEGLMRAATRLRDAFDCEIYPVNAYQLPTSPGVVAGMGSAAAAPPAEQSDLRELTVRKHTERVHALADEFEIPAERLYIREGAPGTVVPEVADEIDADMVVLGARSIGRLERLVSVVTVEPVMSRTNCDVFIVRENVEADVPAAEERPVEGTPKFSLERAITHPHDTFDSPQQVAALSDLSIELRGRILQAWEYDIRAGMRTESEGGKVADIEVNELDDILAARSVLRMKREKIDDIHPTLEARSG